MAYVNDLERCCFLPVESNDLIAVGWLDSNHSYNKGEVSLDLYEKLKELCKSPWQPFISAGYHSCNLCQFDGPSFKSNLYIPHEGKIYIAPTAVEHYVATHRYLPPTIFIAAVLACPKMNSIQYKKGILSNGGRVLVKGK